MESPAESQYRPRARERIYRGRFRGEDGRHEVCVDGWRPLVHIVRQSPDGFAWGYDGPSPNDLALALLADALGEDPEPGWSDGSTLSDDLYRTFQVDVRGRRSQGMKTGAASGGSPRVTAAHSSSPRSGPSRLMTGTGLRTPRVSCAGIFIGGSTSAAPFPG